VAEVPDFVDDGGAGHVPKIGQPAFLPSLPNVRLCKNEMAVNSPALQGGGPTSSSVS
jgi:hypothetical protein